MVMQVSAWDCVIIPGSSRIDQRWRLAKIVGMSYYMKTIRLRNEINGGG